jgi:hypothetical protein
MFNLSDFEVISSDAEVILSDVYGHRQNYGKKTFNLDRRRLHPIFP